MSTPTKTTGIQSRSCCGGSAGGQKTAEEVEFIIWNGAEPETLDPHLISGVPEHRIYESIGEGLCIYDPKSARGIPGLAESWEISDDGTVKVWGLDDGMPHESEIMVGLVITDNDGHVRSFAGSRLRGEATPRRHHNA